MPGIVLRVGVRGMALPHRVSVLYGSGLPGGYRCRREELDGGRSRGRIQDSELWALGQREELKVLAWVRLREVSVSKHPVSVIQNRLCIGEWF